MKVLVGSKNPGKVQGAKNALEKYYQNVEVIGVKVPSGVSEEPIDDEIYQGAKNRVEALIVYAKENNIDADFFMAVESGMTNRLGKWMITNIAVISGKNGKMSYGTSASFPVPEKMVQKIQTETLGNVMDELFDQSNLHSGTGGVGLLTHGVITRIDLNTQAFIMALTEFVNGDKWSDW